MIKYKSTYMLGFYNPNYVISLIIKEEMKKCVEKQADL
jgi:hypothetical protein